MGNFSVWDEWHDCKEHSGDDRTGLNENHSSSHLQRYQKIAAEIHSSSRSKEVSTKSIVIVCSL
jgi:hypothetical protein